MVIYFDYVECWLFFPWKRYVHIEIHTKKYVYNYMYIIYIYIIKYIKQIICVYIWS